MFAFISLLFDLSHADVDLVIREFRVEERFFFAAHSAQRWSQKRNRLGVSIPKNVKISLEAQAIRLNPNFYIEKRDTSG